MKSVIVSLALGAALAGPALALDLVPVGTAGNWEILKDPNHGDACLAQAGYADGTYARIGFRDGGKKGFIANFNPAWKEFEPERRYPVTFTIDQDSFEGEALGTRLGEMPGVEVGFDNPDFLQEFAEGEEVTFSSNGAEVAKLGLDGSLDALAAAAECQGL